MRNCAENRTARKEWIARRRQKAETSLPSGLFWLSLLCVLWNGCPGAPVPEHAEQREPEKARGQRCLCLLPSSSYPFFACCAIFRAVPHSVTSLSLTISTFNDVNKVLQMRTHLFSGPEL